MSSVCTVTPCARCSPTPFLRDTEGASLPDDPRSGPYTGVIDRILEDDPVSSTGQALNLPKKQRHTAKRIHERLRDEYGFDGGYTIVKDYVRKHGRRQRTRTFTELVSHYLFSDRFGRPGKGNDKGKVEGMVGYTRRNFLVPIPPFESFDSLNSHLEERCLKRTEAKLRGHTETIGERMERDLDALLPLPAVPYDASDRHTTRVSSLSLVRYRTNDYSVPVAYGHREVLVRGYVDEVVISYGTDVIVRHRRSYKRDDFVFDPVHYLPLLERKTGALDQAAPLVGWDLPEEFGTLRRLLESRMGRRGKREFVAVLRLMETFSLDDVHVAVRDAIGLGALSFDAVKLSIARVFRPVIATFFSPP